MDIYIAIYAYTVDNMLIFLLRFRFVWHYNRNDKNDEDDGDDDTMLLLMMI
jgi:hypothetical protein